MSHHYEPAPEGKDPELWEVAQKRASFKSHLVSYVLVNIFLWALWYFTAFGNADFTEDDILVPWPVWTTLGWGIGLAYHFAGAYIFPKGNAVEREYEKLKNQKK